MPFDWQYLRLAEFLKDFTGTEVSHDATKRSAVSRAYYAGFGLARCHAEGQGFQAVRDVEDHKGLQHHFMRTNRSNIANHLWRLRGWRNQADYDDEMINLPLLARESIAEFEEGFGTPWTGPLVAGRPAALDPPARRQ